MIARCPFCGSDDVISTATFVDWYRVECLKCQACGPSCDDSHEAERKWSDIPYLSSRISEMPLYKEGQHFYLRTDGPSIIRECRG